MPNQHENSTKFRLMPVIILLVLGIVAITGCTKKKDDSSEEMLALFGLMKLQEEAALRAAQQNADIALAVSRMVPEAIRSNINSLALRTNSKDFLRSSVTQSVKNAPYLKLTSLEKESGSCVITNNSFDCDAIISGTVYCKTQGTMTFKNMKMKINGNFPYYNYSTQGNSNESEIEIDFTSIQNGIITFNNCGTDFITYTGKMEQATLHGNVTVSSNGKIKGLSSYRFEHGTNNANIISGYTAKITNNLDQEESGTVTLSNFQFNGNSVPDQTFTSEHNMKIKQTIDNTYTVENTYSYDNSPLNTTATSTIKISTEIVKGTVKVNGNVVHEFNNYKYEQTCKSKYTEPMKCE